MAPMDKNTSNAYSGKFVSILESADSAATIQDTYSTSNRITPYYNFATGQNPVGLNSGQSAKYSLWFTDTRANFPDSTRKLDTVSGASYPQGDAGSAVPVIWPFNYQRMMLTPDADFIPAPVVNGAKVSLLIFFCTSGTDKQLYPALSNFLTFDGAAAADCAATDQDSWQAKYPS